MPHFDLRVLESLCYSSFCHIEIAKVRNNVKRNERKEKKNTFHPIFPFNSKHYTLNFLYLCTRKNTEIVNSTINSQIICFTFTKVMSL